MTILTGFAEISLGRMIVLMGLPPFLFVFLLSVISGLIFLPIIRRIMPGQKVRDDGPSTHLKKTGTPTFGGVIFILPILAMTIIFPLINLPADYSAQSQGGGAEAAKKVFAFMSGEGGRISPLTVIGIFALYCGIVGFIDDFIKVKINPKGLKALSKSILLLLGIVPFTVYYLNFSGVEPYFLMPFTDLSFGGVPIEVTSGFGKIIYGAIIIGVLYFIGNSVNITDGVDGLASSVTAVASVFLGIIGSSLNSYNSRISAFFIFGITGACIAFMFFNHYPARIFMGDTGSQFLGAAVGATAVFMGVFWILLLVGIVYVMESVSVIAQVLHFKRTGKRLFKMAPLHHHYEISGWSEWKIVFVFSFIGIIGGLLSLWMTL